MAAYGTNDGLEEWVEAQGLELPVGVSLDALRTVGSSYVDAAYAHRLTCSKKAGGFSQERAWPRSGHYIHGQEVPHDFIPQDWVNASYRAAYLQATNPGWATNSVNPNRITRREKVDVIEREFFANGDNGPAADVAAGMPADGVINGLVSTWLCSATRGINNLFRVI